MQIILENYLIIILVGLFFVFALIGYLIDLLRNNNTNISKEDISSTVAPVEITKIEDSKKTEEQKQEDNNLDELLENYDKEK